MQLVIVVFLFVIFGQAPNLSSLSDLLSWEFSVENLDQDLIVAEVVRHIDGDTLIARIEGKEQRIRYIMIDTPEITSGKNEEYGQEALEFVESKVVPGQKIYLEYDEQKYDPYDRLLAYIYLEDGSMLNKLLLENGLAKMIVFKPNNKYENEFRLIEEQAKKRKVGIWSEQ